MRDFNLDSARIESLHNSSMQDTCIINTISGSTTDSYGELIKTSASTVSICGITTLGGSKSFNGDTTVYKWDASVRLPITAVINNSDTITITKQGNRTVNITYSIVNLSIGHSEIVVKCNRLEV